MKKKILLIFILLIFCKGLSAQVTYAVDDPGMFLLLYKNISDFNTLDTSFLNVTYKLDYIEDPAVRDVKTDLMVLQIGNRYSKFFSLNLHRNDSVCTIISKMTMNVPLNTGTEKGYEIFRNLSTGNLTVTNRIPFSQKVFRYEEKYETIKWTFEKGRDTILGYACNRATADFRGRHYTAWYTTGIPSQLGPWKFSGLPGLILKVCDDKNEYVFECTGLSQQPEPIVRYDWKYQDVPKRKWMDFEKYVYTNAGKYIKSTGVNIVLCSSNSKPHEISITWALPYNPIER